MIISKSPLESAPAPASMAGDAAKGETVSSWLGRSQEEYMEGLRTRAQRIAILAIASIVLGLSTPPGSHAQGNCPPSILSWPELIYWGIQHGPLGESYKFQANGYYEYHRYGATTTEEEGHYTTKGDKLVLTPSGGAEKVFTYRIGTAEPTAHQPQLFLTYPSGRQEFYYGMFIPGHNSRPVIDAMRSGNVNSYPCWAR
jgi:hypothetical protein